MNDETNLPVTVLGIDAGARGVGVSIFKGNDLIFYAVKSIKSASGDESLSKMKKILGKLIADYGVDAVALEKIVFIQQHRSFVKVVYDEIKDFLKEQRVKFFEYNPKATWQMICGAKEPTKKNTTLLLAQRYPELVRYFSVPRLWQKRYYAQLFDAVAVGSVCAGERQEGETDDQI